MKSTFAKSLLSDYIIDLDCDMSRSKIKGTVNLVLMNQIKGVQWVLFRKKYYHNGRKYVTLTFEIWPWPFFLTLNLDIWPWDWYIITLMLWRKNCKDNLTSPDAKTVRRTLSGDNNPDRYFVKEHSATNQKFLRLPVPKVIFMFFVCV